MGVMYSVVDSTRSFRYELGKGGWSELLDSCDSNEFIVSDALFRTVLEILDDDHALARRVVDELKIVFGDGASVTLESDVSCDDYYDFELRGTRYLQNGDGSSCAIDVTQWRINQEREGV